MKIALYICFVTLAAGCAMTNTSQSGAYKYLYDYESRDMHPEYVVYHDSDDSTTVYFRIRSTEILYARSGSSAPFTAKLNIRVEMSESKMQIPDTCSFDIVDVAKEKQGWLLGSIRIGMRPGMWNMLIEFTDVTKNLVQPSYLIIDKTSAYTAQNYLVRKLETGEPIFGGFACPGQFIEVESNRNKGDQKLLHIGSEVKLPPPPFSSNTPEIPDFNKATEIKIAPDSAGLWIFEVESGNYFMTLDAFHKMGLMIKTSNEYYPEIKSIEALEWPLRFITTKTEHEDIIKDKYPKLMIDKFWLECAGNKDHARELIKIYYGRVEEANYYFSTFTEGWRTDRGMIHLIFGNPTKILRFTDTETWQYGDDGAAGLLSFVFRKVETPLSTNVYVLDRDPGFKQYWERGVQTWRNGRVYND